MEASLQVSVLSVIYDYVIIKEGNVLLKLINNS